MATETQFPGTLIKEHMPVGGTVNFMTSSAAFDK
jgi:hypothetical protein